MIVDYMSKAITIKDYMPTSITIKGDMSEIANNDMSKNYQHQQYYIWKPLPYIYGKSSPTICRETININNNMSENCTVDILGNHQI